MSRTSADAGPLATSISTTRPVAVSELKRAWSAVQGGEFRQVRVRGFGPPTGGQGRTPQSARPLFEPVSDRRWVPAPLERVLPVLGAAGSVGCSTVALALATAAAGGIDAPRVAKSRVVECCSAPTSGLAAASTAELGHHESGWVQGTRGGVLLERASRVFASAGQVPAPAPLHEATSPDVDRHIDRTIDRPSGRSECLTVLDTGWEVGHLLAGEGWLAELVRMAPVVVVVARPTIPGFRRLEAVLELLEADHGVATQIAVLGGRRKRWAKGVEHSAGPRTRSALREHRMHEIPEDRHLAVAGLGSMPLPPGLVAAAEQLLDATISTLNTLAAPRFRGHGSELFAGGDQVDEVLRYRVTTDGTAEPTSRQPVGPVGCESSSSSRSATASRFDADTHLGSGTNPEGTA